jgi:poly(A) polymerase
VTERLRIEPAWLRQAPLRELIGALDSRGEEARVIGGAVRNTLLGEAPGDFDIATTALPAEVTRRVVAAGFKAVPTGLDHGTITVVADGRPFEITTLREDIETFGRRAKVAFGRNWKHDAERRDFTINALSVSRDGIVHDYVGGLSDISARRVRFIGCASRRIAEDYLRILRFFRFHAAYGEGAPDPQGLAAAIAGRAGLQFLSRERVRMELLKLLAARRAAAALTVMAESGLLDPVLGGVPLLADFANMVEVEAVLGLKADPVRRLGALAARVVEDADRLRERLRMANAEHERVRSMADGWWRVSPELDEQRARVLLYQLGCVRFIDRVLLAWARFRMSGEDASWRGLAMLPHRWTAPVFPLRASDFIKRGLPKGPRLGAALAAAEEAWKAAGFPLDQAALAAIADAASAT